MATEPGDSTVLTIRVSASLERRLTREARRRRCTKSELAREILTGHFAGDNEPDGIAEATRQSRLVSGRRSEKDALAFTLAVADARGWR